MEFEAIEIFQRLLLRSLLWLCFFFIPHALVLVAAYCKWASPSGSFHWIYKPIRFRISQRVMGFAHAVSMSYLGTLDFVNSGYKFDTFAQNTAYQEWVIEFSLAYLIADTCLDIVRGPELLYFFHHFSLSTCFFCSIYYGHSGAAMGMMVLSVGEISNIFMVPWTAARLCEWKETASILSYPTTISFTILRTTAAPYFTYDFFANAFTTTHSISPAFVAIYSATFVIVLLGSWYWVYLLIRGFVKHHKGGDEVKKE